MLSIPIFNIAIQPLSARSRELIYFDAQKRWGARSRKTHKQYFHTNVHGNQRQISAYLKASNSISGKTRNDEWF